MRIFNKFMCVPFTGTSAGIPKLGMQIEEFKCFHCGDVTRVVVKEDCIDWKAVAESYRQALESQMNFFDQLVQDVSVMHGDNPIIDYIQNQRTLALARLATDLDRPVSES